MPPIKKILLDTNFLLIPGQFKVDIFSELERACDFNFKVYILDKTVKELENILKNQKGKDKAAAKLALSLIETKPLNIIHSNSKPVDDLIVDIAREEGFIVATQDKQLRQRLKKHDIPMIVLRQKKYLKLI